jgi:TolA-binding protein
MLNVQIISILVGFLGGVGLLIGGCGYAYSSWQQGKDKYKDNLIADLKLTISQREADISQLNQDKTLLITSHQTQLTEMQKELSELQGKFSEQSKKLEEYRTILENRDPKTIKMLENISKGIETLNAHQVTQETATGKVATTLAKKNKKFIEIKRT